MLLHDIIIINISKINTFRFQSNVYHKAQIAKMEPFVEFKRKAVIIVPTHDNLRRRTSDAKRKNEIIHEVPFGDLCDMKCKAPIFNLFFILSIHLFTQLCRWLKLLMAEKHMSCRIFPRNSLC